MSEQDQGLSELVTKLTEDEQAFAQVYNYLLPRIHGYLLRRTGSRETAEDLSSKTFLKVVENLCSFSGNGKAFTAWVYRIANNCLIDYYRSTSSQTKIFFYSNEDLSRLETPSDDDTKQLLQEREAKEQIVKMLNLLDPAEQEILSLKFLEELSHEELAEILRLKKNAVAVKLHRAMEKLKKIAIKSNYDVWEKL